MVSHPFAVKLRRDGAPAFNSKQSYVSEEWIKSKPEFWKAKAAAARPGADEKKAAK